MGSTVLPYLNPTQAYVALTMLTAVLMMRRTKKNFILLAILSICLLNEILSLVFLMNGLTIVLLITITSTVHNCAWLLLLYEVIRRKTLRWLLAVYISLAIANMLFIDGVASFNYNTFILGAFLYLLYFIYESFYRLRAEDFTFFTDNDYTLLSAPVLFFIGLSFIFGFKSIVLS